MSTLLYATVTGSKEAEVTKASTLSEGVSKLVETVAALVPTEILVVHAAILGLTTATTEATAETAAVTTITEPVCLRVAFFGLLVFSSLLYAVPRWISLRSQKESWKWPGDCFRSLIPPAAFFAWTLLQETSALTAVHPNWAAGPRAIGGAFFALVLFLIANGLAYAKPEGDGNATAQKRAVRGGGGSMSLTPGEQAAGNAGDAEAGH